MTVATKTATKPTALDTAWEAHQDRERQAFAERFAAETAEREQAQAAEAASAEEQEKLTATRQAAEERLTQVLRSAETDLQVFAGVCQAIQIAANEHYNAGVALGLSSGVSSAVRDRLSERISHVLRVEANLPDFQQSMSPSGRSPLGEPAAPYQSNMTDRPPLPNRRELHDVTEGYPGQNPMSRPVVKTELQKADGTWVDMPIGSYDWPDGVEP